mmetsp:Transcript_13860/g.38960  ORF Transcript_13860/g.38960 Transcript_13860/m.38960 type:complete len:216 (+) Transcript_13860:103-750(+)
MTCKFSQNCLYRMHKIERRVLYGRNCNEIPRRSTTQHITTWVSDMDHELHSLQNSSGVEKGFRSQPSVPFEERAPTITSRSIVRTADVIGPASVCPCAKTASKDSSSVPVARRAMGTTSAAVPVQKASVAFFTSPTVTSRDDTVMLASWPVLFIMASFRSSANSCTMVMTESRVTPGKIVPRSREGVTISPVFRTKKMLAADISCKIAESREPSM